jgi:hypothetical protein
LHAAKRHVHAPSWRLHGPWWRLHGPWRMPTGRRDDYRGRSALKIKMGLVIAPPWIETRLAGQSARGPERPNRTRTPFALRFRV